MPRWSRDELEEAFRTYWRTGAVGEDWDAWADLFTEDAAYREHVLGPKAGREAIRAWIKPIMAQFGEIYTAYEWHLIDEAAGRVVVYMQNRRDHPSGTGTIDFPGITILEYAGAGLFRYQEDYWCLRTAKECHARFHEAVTRCGDRGLGGGRFEALEAERRAAALAVFARGG
jgi:hypothetical protein